AQVEPVLDGAGTMESVTNTVQHLLRKVTSDVPTLFKGDIATVDQLTLNLVSRTDKGDTVHSRHDCLLHDFTRDLALQQLSQAVTLGRVLVDEFVDLVSDEGVHVG